MPPRLRSACIAAAAVLVCDQVLQHGPLRDGVMLSRRIAPFDPPLLAPTQRDALERLRASAADAADACGLDPELGWCPPSASGEAEQRFDWAGARVGRHELARERSARVRRVVVVGDSFTFGHGNRAEETWCSLVDQAREDLEVANLGVSGYGLDQMLLRFERDGLPLAPDEVWIAFVPGTALRIVNVYVPALRRWSPSPAFKPRFELNERGELLLVANPASSCAQAAALLSDQRSFLAAVAGHDRFVGRDPIAWAPAGSSALHRSGFARIALTLASCGGRDPFPELEDPASELHRLALAILARIERTALASGASCRLLLLPDRDGLEAWRTSGRRPGTGLASAWASGRAVVLDLAPAFEAAGGPGAAELWQDDGHYTGAGNALVAQALLAYLGTP